MSPKNLTKYYEIWIFELVRQQNQNVKFLMGRLALPSYYSGGECAVWVSLMLCTAYVLIVHHIMATVKYKMYTYETFLLLYRRNDVILN